MNVWVLLLYSLLLFAAFLLVVFLTLFFITKVRVHALYNSEEAQDENRIAQQNIPAENANETTPPE